MKLSLVRLFFFFLIILFQSRWHVSLVVQSSIHRCLTPGTVGVAAAAAIATGRKRKRPHVFETNPSIRKRQQNRLLRSVMRNCTDIIYSIL